MKEWVIGAPYTTETILEETDTTLIVACDGVILTLKIDMGRLPGSRRC